MADTMKKIPRISLEQLTNEIVENARSDRERLVEFADGLKEFAQKGSKTDDEDLDARMDPEVALALSEQIAKVSDSLTKINQQLIELVKIDAKKNEGAGNGKFSNGEKESIYEEMEGRGDLDA